jgi:mitogen-activated protein kinase 7
MLKSDDFYTVTIENSQEKFTIHKQYKIIRKVGAGSYGSVCSALNVNTNEGKSITHFQMNSY